MIAHLPAPTVAWGAWHGGRVSTRATCVLAPNAGPMTLDGTNTWVLREPASEQVVVVDPGPLDAEHLDAVRAQAMAQGGRIALILLTHRHADHAESARHFSAQVGAPVRALGRGHHDLRDGDHLDVAGLEMAVVATPGHTSDSLSLVLPADEALVSGDTILGRGTTVVAWPDGSLHEYLDSLERLARLCEGGTVRRILPGHGPAIEDAAAMVTGYQSHRRERLEQVAAALAAGVRTPRAIVELVYADQPQSVWEAAEWSVRAQIEYLTHT